MEKVIDQLGIGDEILKMYSDGISVRKIRELLIRKHPEIPIFPSQNSIYGYIKECRGQPLDKSRLTGVFTDDMDLVYKKVNVILDREYDTQTRKYLMITTREIREDLESIKEEYRDFVDRFMNEFRMQVLEPFFQKYPDGNKEFIEMVADYLGYVKGKGCERNSGNFLSKF